MQLDACCVTLSPQFTTEALTFSLTQGEHAMVVGANGAGKSVLLQVLAGEGKVQSGARDIKKRVAVVSTHRQQQLIATEKQKDDADILDVVPTPTKVKDMLPDSAQEEFGSLYSLLGLVALMEQPFLSLSTGETRKLLFAMALTSEPDIVLMDDPWEGLDDKTREALIHYLEGIHDQIQIVIAINRLQDMPAVSAVLTIMEQGMVVSQSTSATGHKENIAACETWFHLQQDDVVLPDTTSECKDSALLPDTPLVKLENGTVSYGEKTVFAGLDWEVIPGGHWQIIGPNGSGKTCLLTLVTGDNPHCYTNTLTVFGIRRGSGESIWDIKKHIGILSNAFHLSYRVNCAVIDVLLSGFFDSVGLYERPSQAQRLVALSWLNTLKMSEHRDTPFQSLSFGAQRLILIARAMIKHPPLLILDEPCNGLDAINRLTVLALIEQLARDGRTTLLYVNHHHEDAIPSIQHVLSMSDY